MPFDSYQIKAFRKKLGLSQTELGNILGVPQSTVGRWETGSTFPNARHIGLMCDLGYAQGIRPSFFFPNYSRIDMKGEPHEQHYSRR